MVFTRSSNTMFTIDVWCECFMKRPSGQHPLNSAMHSFIAAYTHTHMIDMFSQCWYALNHSPATVSLHFETNQVRTNHSACYFVSHSIMSSLKNKDYCRILNCVNNLGTSDKSQKMCRYILNTSEFDLEYT